MTKEQYLDPSILSKTDNYFLLARTIVEGFITGMHRSLYHGFGSEFVHYRNYTAGDDLKYVDWKVYARLGKLQVKVFQEETNTNCYIVLDTSKSMDYSGSGERVSKLEYGKILAACIAYMVSRQGDNVGFYAYDSQLRSCIKPGHRTGQVQNICGELTRLQAHGSCAHDKILGQLAELFRRRGLIILITDFMETGDGFRKAIRYFRVSHHDCIVFNILDDDELSFPFGDTVRFTDSETGNEITTAPELVRERYLKAVNAYFQEVKDFCREDNVDYNRIMTSAPLAKALSSYLHRREMFK